MRFVKPRDFVNLLLIGMHLPIAWFFPERIWRSITRVLGQIHVRLSGERGQHLLVVPRLVNVTTRELEIGFHQHNHWELLENLRELAPWGWNPRLDVIGRSHIERALDAGAGAILWFCPFVHADIVFKKALHGAGFAISHLSAATHGFSDTKFGVAVLNPLKTSIEQRYLKERCVIGPGGAGPAIRRLVERLTANEVVSIAAIHTGRRWAEREFFGGRLRLAKGAANLAITTGAALLPLFVVPAKRGYEVRVDSPLVPKSHAVDDAEDEIIDAYVPILASYVATYPTLWRGWLDPPHLWKPGL